MATQMQVRGGTTAENLLFTGAQREVTVDTDSHSLIVHDGVTAGGYRSATQQQLSNGTFYYNEDAGSAADAYMLVPKSTTNVPTGYIDGVQFGFVTTKPNTGPSTAVFQGLGMRSLKFPGGVDPLAGDISGRVTLVYDAANGWLEIQRKPATAQSQIASISASVSTNSLTLSMLPRIIDFRSSSSNNGSINTRNVTTPLSLIVPSGATLGTINGVLSRLVLLAIYGPVNVELAVVNIAGGVNLDETGFVNTISISAASNSANVVYSTVSRSGVPFRVIGVVDSTQPTAGSWSSAPTLIQGAGGQAISAMSSIGYSQTWQNVTGSRAVGTTYYNTTGRPIMLMVSIVNGGANASMVYTVGGVGFVQLNINTTGSTATLPVIVPPGQAYQVTATGTLSGWLELR